jgi:hypothetical protein
VLVCLPFLTYYVDRTHAPLGTNDHWTGCRRRGRKGYEPELFPCLHTLDVPREALQPLINKFRSLEYINRPAWAGTDHELVYLDRAFTAPVRTDFRDERDFESRVRARDEFLAKCQLKDLYLECGWDVNAVSQHAFRRDEFLEKRRRHLDTIYRHRLEENERHRGL